MSEVMLKIGSTVCMLYIAEIIANQKCTLFVRSTSTEGGEGYKKLILASKIRQHTMGGNAILLFPLAVKIQLESGHRVHRSVVC